MRAYALLSDRPNSDAPGNSALVDIDLKTMKQGIMYPIKSEIKVTSLAVSPDAGTLYVLDEGRGDPKTNGGVIRLDASQGFIQYVDTTFVHQGRDLVLSSDGHTLFIAAFLSVVRLDSATMKVTGTVPIDGELRSIALSQDDQTLAIAAVHDGQQGRVYLVDAANMTLIKAIDIQETDPKKQQLPPDLGDVVFVEPERVMVWSFSLNSVYQVDVAKRIQVLSDTISLGFPLDPGALKNIRNSNNQLSGSSGAARVCLVSDEQLAIIEASQSNFIINPTRQPFMARIAPDGKSLYVCVQQDGNDPHVPEVSFYDELDLYKYNPIAKTHTLIPGIFRFDKPHMFVRDLLIVDPFVPGVPVSQYTTLAEAVHILSGIVNDAAGVYLGADGKLHRSPGFDPMGDSLWGRFSPSTQDALVGLALNGMASVIHDIEIRRRLQRDALSLVRRSVEQMLHALSSKRT